MIIPISCLLNSSVRRKDATIGQQIRSASPRSKFVLPGIFILDGTQPARRVATSPVTRAEYVSSLVKQGVLIKNGTAF